MTPPEKAAAAAEEFCSRMSISAEQAKFAFGIQGIVGDFDMVHTLFTAPADNAIIARQNPRRVYLAFCSPVITSRVAPHAMPGGGGDGFGVGPNIGDLEIHWAKHAILTTMPWQCFGFAAGSIAVYEVIWSPRR